MMQSSITRLHDGGRDVSPRFVVLRHVDPAGVHYDLMIEWGGILATWKAALPPETSNHEPWSCRRIQDHRRDYLDYEGPISGNRGHVTRHDAGECVIEEKGSERLVVVFHGKKLTGRYDLVLRDSNDHGWSLSRLSAD